MGFAQEMKDFLGAWEKGEKINASQTDREYKAALTDSTTKKTVRDNDPDTLELADKQARANLAKTQAGIGYTGANTRLINERLKQLRDPQGAGAVGSGLLPPVAPNTTGAIPLQNTIKTDPDMAYAEGGAVPTPEEMADARTRLAADLAMNETTRRPLWRGNKIEVNGAVLDSISDDAHNRKGNNRTFRFADGGVVPDDGPDAEPDADADDGALPMAGSSGATDISARSRMSSDGVPTVIAPQLREDAVKAGLTFGANAFGLGQVGAIRTNAQKLAAQQYAAGAGGLTPQEMEAAKKAVDPEGKLSDAQRNLAALGSVYQFQMNKGNPEGAQRVAFQMLQHYRVASQRYAAIAAHAAENGDLDLATKAAVKAYANIPDGRDFNVVKTADGKLQYTYTDAETGKTLSKGIATPQQLASSAMGLAQGGFDKALLMAAGAKEAAKKDGGAVKVSDRAKLGEMSAEPVTAAKEAWVKANPDKPADDEYWGKLGDATQHILSDNPKTTPREAFKAAQALYTLNKDDPKKDNFKVIKDESNEGMNTVKLSSGHTIKLSDDQLEPIMLERAAQRKAREEKDKTAEADKKKPGMLEKAGAVGSAVLDAGADVADKAATIGGILGRGAIDAIPDSVKGAIDNGTWDARQAIRRGAGALSNPGTADEVGAPL